MANTRAPGVTSSSSATARPAEPVREELLAAMLSATNRGGVPIRRSFLQMPLDRNNPGPRGAALGKIVATKDAGTLDAYLLIHAMASSSAPYSASFPAWSWVRAMGFDKAAEPTAARTHWAKVTSKLVKLGLIRRRREGNSMGYILLDESGSGEPYTRPKSLSDGRWSTLPYSYWTEGLRESFDLATKALLLIALDQPDEFTLPSERAPEWYGISASTAKRGLRSLVDASILTFESEWRIAPKSATGLAEVRKYSTVPEWSSDERRRIMSKPNARRKPEVVFRGIDLTSEVEESA